MQHFSKLYVLTRQLQVKCQLAFAVLADKAQTKEAEKRMTEMYKQEFKVFGSAAELCNYLLELLAVSGEGKDFAIRREHIGKIYNVGGGLPPASNKYLSVVDVPELTKEQVQGQPGFLLALASQDSLAKTAASVSGNFVIITEEMCSDQTLSFRSRRNIKALVAGEGFAAKLLERIGLPEHEKSSLPQLLASIMVDRDNVP